MEGGQVGEVGVHGLLVVSIFALSYFLHGTNSCWLTHLDQREAASRTSFQDHVTL